MCIRDSYIGWLKTVGPWRALGTGLLTLAAGLLLFFSLPLPFCGVCLLLGLIRIPAAVSGQGHAIKRLVFTARVKRLYVTAALLTCALTLAAALTLSLIHISNRRRIPLLRSLLHSSGNAASIPTATAGCGCGYREFYTNKPNSKWVTDISYIHTKQGVLYLSMICDLYDNSIVAYKTGSGHEAGEKDSRCGVAAPQRPGLSIHVTSIFPAN